MFALIRALAPWLTRAAVGLALVGVLLGATGCANWPIWSTDRMSTMDPKGDLAAMQFDLWLVTLWVTMVIFVLVGGLLAFAIWKFREKKSHAGQPLPEQSHGNALVEVGTIAFSAGALVIIAIPTLQGIWMMHSLPSDVPPEEVVEITVEGYQWWWAFEYPEDGIRTANEMVIPVNRVVKLNLRSRGTGEVGEVIHSFWVPKIAGKTDLMPGRQNWMWIRAREEGHYFGMCAEFCGESHSRMYFRVNVVSEEEYAAWRAKYRQGAPAPQPGMSWEQWSAAARESFTPGKTGPLPGDEIQRGAHLFMTSAGCIQCHAVSGSAAVGVKGPNLTHVASRRSLAAGIMENTRDPDDPNSPVDPDLLRENLYNWIVYSERYKPGNHMYTSIRRERSPEELADLAKKLDENNLKIIQENVLTEADYRAIAAWLATLK